MAGEAKAFSIEFDREFIEKVEDKLLLIKQKIAMQALSGVTLKMPVDEGRARGNTNVAINEIDTSVTFVVDPSGTATIQRGQAVIFSDDDPFSVITVSNSVPYINRLENGWSKQAPNGMFAVTVAEIQTQFQRVQ